MTLILSCLAAFVSILVFYTNEKARELKVSLLCFIYSGASLMWLIDLIVEMVKEGAEAFAIEPVEVLSDTVLGLAVIALGLLVYVIYLLIKDPKHIIHK